MASDHELGGQGAAWPEPGAREEVLAAVLEHVPAAIAHLDPSLVFRWANPAFSLLYHVPMDQLIGHSFEEVFPGSAGELLSSLTQVVETGLPVLDHALRFVFEGPTGPRETFWEASLRPMGPPVYGVLLLTTDVTERVLHERQQAQRIADLRDADTLKDQVLGLVSHELRTPLHALMGFGRLLQRGGGDSLSPRQAGYVERMLQVSGHLARIVNDILELGQLQAGMLTLELEPIDLPAIAAEVAASLAPLAEQKRMTLEVATRPVPRALGHAQRTHQVLLNLINNALKFTPDGGSVRVSFEVAGDRVRCEVTDSGPGIASADQARLFLPFSQVTGSVRRDQGTGLGLSISRGLIEAQHGAIGVQSAPGSGSVFWFELPVAPGESQAA